MCHPKNIVFFNNEMIDGWMNARPASDLSYKGTRVFFLLRYSTLNNVIYLHDCIKKDSNHCKFHRNQRKTSLS